MCKQKTKKVYRFLQQKKKKKIDVHTVNRKKAKKVHRFLQYGRKKMIDVHTVNQKKQRKNIDSYNTEEKND